MIDAALRFFGTAGDNSAHGGSPPSASGLRHTDSLETAERVFRNGKTAFDAGDYAAAARQFETVIDLRHDDADAHNYLGVCRLRQGDIEDASDCFVLALYHRPGFPVAMHNLALLAQRRGDIRQAIDLLERAIALDASLALAHNDLGYILACELGDVEHGAAHIETALGLRPGDPDVVCNHSMVLLQRGEVEEAIAVCDRLLACHPDLHAARVNRALAKLKIGRYAEAWPDYEARKFLAADFVARSLPLPDWLGQPLDNKRLLVYAEQGIGDQMMFASCLPEVLARADACIVECAPKLVPLFRRSFPLARVESQGDDRHLAGLVTAARFDYKVAIGSLPLFLRKDASAFPRHRGYLRADAERVNYWRGRLARLGQGPKVGISWFGGAVTTGGDARSTRLEDWLPIVQHSGCHFVSVQYGDAMHEITAFADAHRLPLYHWPEALGDYDETVALVAALDHIISVQTAVAHLAGALGKPAWVALPAIAEWRYLSDGPSMPWYPSVRLFRQQRPGEWSAALASIAAELSAQFTGERCS